MNSPSILLADEPCANLDSQTSKSILDLFARLNEDLDQTIVMVSHEDWHKEYFCRIVTLRDGLIGGGYGGVQEGVTCSTGWSFMQSP